MEIDEDAFDIDGEDDILDDIFVDFMQIWKHSRNSRTLL